jgi:branched-chain amino acid transport system substrate-binding protein
MQILGDAITATGGLNEDKLAEHMHSHSFKTIVGDISFGPDGEWAEPRALFVQYHGIKDNNLDQFRDDSHITILYPEKYKSGTVRWPFGEARN